MSRDFTDLLKEIARGPKGARHLTLAEAQEAADAILDQTASSAQIGAFLAAERLKTESADELLAFSCALRSRCLSIGESWHSDKGLDLLGPFDGRRQSFHSEIPAAFILLSLGIPVLFHGVLTPLPPNRGIGIYEVLQALDLPLGTGSADAQKIYQHYGAAFVNTEFVCPALGRLRFLREELSMRTLFNTVEKTLNPAGNSKVIIGMFHRNRQPVLIDFLSQLTYYQEILLVPGVEGSADLYVHRPTSIWRIRPEANTRKEYRVDPSELNLNPVVNRFTMTPQEQAHAIRAILTREPHPMRDLVLWNAGVELWFMDYTSSWQEGVAIARQALDEGVAASFIRNWQNQSLIDNLSCD